MQQTNLKKRNIIVIWKNHKRLALIILVSAFVMQRKGSVIVTIGEFIKETQPEIHSKLKQMNKHTRSKEKLTEKDIKDLMSHSSYKRCGGAIRQVK